MTQLAEYLQFGFVQRALAAGVFIALACGALGVFLLLRRMAMIGDGLAHFAFGAVGLALLLGAAPLGLALPLTVAAACLILHLPEKSAFYGDAAIGMVSAVGLALGVLLASLGGVIGSAVGIGTVVVVAAVTPLPATIGAATVLATVGLSGSIGLFFGVVPARRAARLDPIVALRSL